MPNSQLKQSQATHRRKVGRPRRAQNSLHLRRLIDEDLPATSFTAHHQISTYCRNNEDLAVWLNMRKDDPAFDVSALV